MSSLLASLSLDYETLANDPIELGIHYGKSILNAVTQKVNEVFTQPAPQPQLNSRYVFSANEFVPRSHRTPTSLPKPEPQQATPAKVEAVQSAAETTSPSYRSRFIRRDYQQVATRAYAARRELIGTV